MGASSVRILTTRSPMNWPEVRNQISNVCYNFWYKLDRNEKAIVLTPFLILSLALFAAIIL